MNEPPSTDFLASAASQQAFELFMRGLFLFAVVLFTVLLVTMLLLVAASYWALMQVDRQHSRGVARLRTRGADLSGASK